MNLGVQALHIDAPEDGRVKLDVTLANGKRLTLFAASYQAPAGWVSKAGWRWGVPHLYARTLEDDAVQAAVTALAADLSGYWLNYCARAARERPDEASQPLKVPLVELGDKEQGTAVVHATLADGREFSILTCTPAWFQEAFEDSELPYYWGPSVLFLGKIEKALAKRAVDEMAQKGDRWLCLYDTPRTTLSKVLAEFKTRTGA